MLQFAPIEHVEGVERDETLAVGMSDVDAAFLHAAHVERLCIDELHYQHAKEILVAEVFRNEDLWQAAEQFA